MLKIRRQQENQSQPNHFLTLHFSYLSFPIHKTWVITPMTLFKIKLYIHSLSQSEGNTGAIVQWHLLKYPTVLATSCLAALQGGDARVEQLVPGPGLHSKVRTAFQPTPSSESKSWGFRLHHKAWLWIVLDGCECSLWGLQRWSAFMRSCGFPTLTGLCPLWANVCISLRGSAEFTSLPML